MARKVTLELFRDVDGSGEYGFAGENTTGDYPSFNAFYNGIGIFHDVFEHWFEKRHKYFMGDYAMNVGGEMVAMGSAMYYYFVLCVRNRPLNSIHSFDSAAMLTTFGALQEAIHYGYTTFGSELLCKVPYQKDTGDWTLESMLSEYIAKFKSLEDRLPEDEQEREGAIVYKKSVSKSKIVRLHRYGYNIAKKLVPDNKENSEMCYKFIEYWNKFTKHIDAEDLARFFNKVVFTITKKNDVLHWQAKLIGIYPTKNYIIRNGNHIPNTEDFYNY